jgi:signal transduction histidine kinase
MSDNPPDLILLDIVMPDMDGYEVCRRLKANEKSRDIPVIFITAKGEVEDEAHGFEVGAVDYITKPVSPPIVTARVRTHLELKRARENLKKQNQELIEAARLREDVERITRHDLKNPLSLIIGFPQVLIETAENLSEKQVKYLKRIEEAGYRMLNMINLSLNLFKMERGIYELQPNPVNLVQVIRKITVELHALAQTRDLSLDVLLYGNPAGDEDTFFVQGEELLCYSMLANLIKNALEAAPKGECVTVAFDNEEMAVIRIHNNGTVPEEIRDKFFEKYVTSGKKMKGTGLGTYSARLIAETQQGSVSMTTSEENGTTITVRLPKASQK